LIEVKNISKSYDGKPAVTDLSFRVPKGCVFGFLGANGAGKSTTLSMITGCLSPDRGTVYVGGIDMSKEPQKAKKLIGYLPETPPLYPDMTPLEYLEFVADAKGIPQDLRDAALKKVIDASGLKGMLHRLVKYLSKGYRQRVGLAGAMLGDPEVLILDEPTAGLDPRQVVETRELVKNYGRDHTVIISSHVLSEIELICDRVLIISHGKAIALDTPQALTDKTNASRVIDLTLKCDAKRAEKILSSLGKEYRFKLVASDGGCGAVVTCPGSEDPCERIFFAFAKENTAILEMKRERSSLEEAFLNLEGR